MDVAVVGLGKIGLPLAVQYATKGHKVVGVDIDPRTITLVNKGIEPFPGENNLKTLLYEAVSSGLLRATASYEEAIPAAKVVVVVVPLLVGSTNLPDYGALDSATSSLGTWLTPNTLVVYETTLPIGTTRKRWAPLLEATSGLKQGKDFHVVFSPERVLTGRVFADLRKYPKLIGGLSSAGVSRAKDFYSSALDFDNRPELLKKNGVWDLGSAEAAEMAKLAETTFRDVNIALANQFAMHADQMGIDVYGVIEACNSQPFSHIHQPGISVGGHCIPVYPHLYLSTDSDPGVVAVSRQVNSQMPNYAVTQLENSLGDFGAKNILILGVSYRPNVKEVAYSGAFDLLREIKNRGGEVFAVDPLYNDEEIRALGFSVGHQNSDIDALVVHTAHEEFLELTEDDFPNCSAVLDGRNFLDRKFWGRSKLIVLGKP